MRSSNRRYTGWSGILLMCALFVILAGSCLAANVDFTRYQPQGHVFANAGGDDLTGHCAYEAQQIVRLPRDKENGSWRLGNLIENKKSAFALLRKDGMAFAQGEGVPEVGNAIIIEGSSGDYQKYGHVVVINKILPGNKAQVTESNWKKFTMTHDRVIDLGDQNIVGFIKTQPLEVYIKDSETRPVALAHASVAEQKPATIEVDVATSHPSAATQTGGTLRGGCFDNLPLIDGRVPTFLDSIGQIADGVEHAKDTAETLKEGIDAAREVEAISKKLKKQLAAFDELTAGLGKYMPVVDKIFKGVEIIGNICDVGTLLVDGYTALATGDKNAFADMVNERVRDAVVDLAKGVGSELGQYLGAAGAAVLGGPAAPLTGFLGGWLGGMAGDWLGEKVGGWAYDKFLADWIKKNIAEFLFDLLCPDTRAVQNDSDPGTDSRQIDATATNTPSGAANIYAPSPYTPKPNEQKPYQSPAPYKWPKPIKW